MKIFEIHSEKPRVYSDEITIWDILLHFANSNSQRNRGKTPRVAANFAKLISFVKSLSSTHLKIHMLTLPMRLQHSSATQRTVAQTARFRSPQAIAHTLGRQ